MSLLCSFCLFPSLLMENLCGHLICMQCIQNPKFECVKCLEKLLNDRYENINDLDDEILKQIIKKNPFIVSILNIKKDELIEYAIRISPFIICIEKYQSDKNIRIALNLNGNVVTFIKKMSIPYAYIAIKTTPEVLPNINPKYLNSELIFKTILMKPQILKKLDWINVPDYLYELLLERDPSNIIYFKIQRREWCLFALRKDGNLLQYMIQTPEYCLEAIQQNPKAFQYVDEEFQNFQLAKIAIEHDPLMIKYSIIQYEVLIPDALRKMPTLIEHIYDQKLEYCEISVDLVPETIRFIKFINIDLWKKAIDKNPMVITYWYKKKEKYLLNLIKEENLKIINEIYNYAISKKPELSKNYLKIQKIN